MVWEAKMIVQLRNVLSGPAGVAGEGVLGRLNTYWNGKRGPVLAPRADALYLSDLVALIPHVLLCFRDDDVFRVEFAGADVQDLLGFDPTGEVLRADDPERVLAELSRIVEVVAASRRPEWPRGSVWSAVALPFVEADNAVSVLLTGIVPSVPDISAEILSFPSR